MKKFISIIFILIMSINTITVNATVQTDALENIVETAIEKSKTPGVSIAIVSDDGTEFLSYGYSDKDNETLVDGDTLFELGSMSKSFTALGILLLESRGELSLDDNVKQYIPWLNLNYKGEYKGEQINGEVDLTVGNFLYHTTGIPFQTIGSIPEGNSDDMLEETVRTLAGTRLDFYPGSKYSYATINYDVLGFIIQEISGISYEDFMKENILEPLGLNKTYMSRTEATETGKMSLGYKMEFFRAYDYDAPEYRGNTPAGYVISCAKDMGRWLRIQMGLQDDIPDLYKDLIEKTHVGNTTVASSGDYYYAAGWNVHIQGEGINHGGTNPNFSSMLQIDNEENIGICVLTNMNTNAPSYIIDNIFNNLYGKDIEKYKSDDYTSMDIKFSWILIASIILGIFYLVLFVISCIEVIRNIRKRKKLKGVKVVGILLTLPIMVFAGYSVYYLPNILLSRLPWGAVNVWSSKSIELGCKSGFIAFVMLMAYILLTFNFPKENEKNYVALIPLGTMNGLMSTLIIFTINETFNRNLEYSKEIFIYFIFSLLLYIYSTKLVQGKMIVITNEIVYEKRIGMIDKIINSSYQAIENIGSARIYSGLNNDTRVFSEIPGMVISLVSNMLTLIFCLYYLIVQSVYAFIASFSVLLINASISFITSRLAKKYWEKNRDVQDIYFGQMSDLVYGFKELALNKLKRLALWGEMKKYSRLEAELSKTASVKFLNFNLYNQLMYNIIFGIVVFVFPIFITDINVNNLRQTLFMVFYLIGPFGAIMGMIPRVTKIKVNLRRINSLIKDLEEISNQDDSMQVIDATNVKNINIKLENVEYSYITKDEKSDNNIEFTLGPINMEIKTGEITYITGGNGSGKSTLAKLITGLYSPQKGEILLNNVKYSMADLGECFSAVYSDFYLFKKLYAIDYENEKDKVDELLELMRIKDKIELNEDGEFKSLKLSTGQRKRLAFVVSCLDEKPIMMFDEWAAEQDPEFRLYFYTELLPMLKNKGKGIIVITHDDRFFDLADKMIKLERGICVN